MGEERGGMESSAEALPDLVNEAKEAHLVAQVLAVSACIAVVGEAALLHHLPEHGWPVGLRDALLR